MRRLHLLVLLLSGFTPAGLSAQEMPPLERAGEKVEAIPLYHLLTRPKVRLLRERMAQQYRLAA